MKELDKRNSDYIFSINTITIVKLLFDILPEFLNAIGAFLRWSFHRILIILNGGQKHSFSYFIYGTEDIKGHNDGVTHRLINVPIAAFIIVLIIYLSIYLFNN